MSDDILKAVKIAQQREGGSKPIIGRVVAVGPGIARVKVGSGIVTAKTQTHARVQVGDSCVIERGQVGRSWIIQSVYPESSAGNDQRLTTNSSGIVNEGVSVSGASAFNVFSSSSNYQAWTELLPSVILRTTRPTVLFSVTLECRLPAATGVGDFYIRCSVDDQTIFGVQTASMRMNSQASTYTVFIPYTVVIPNLSPGLHEFVPELYLHTTTGTFTTSIANATASVIEV